VNEIFDGEDIIFAERGFNNGVVGQRNTLFLDLSVSTLIDEFTDGFEVGFTGR